MHPILVKGHNTGVPVKDKMIGIGVKFFEVLLSFRHKFNHFKLHPQIPLNLIYPETLKLNLLTYLLQMLTLLLPLLRYIRIHPSLPDN
jgi:hypothetical protein